MWRAALLAVAAAVIVLLYFRWRETGFDWGQFGGTLAHLHFGWLVAAAALSLASYYGRALRWAEMIRPYKPEPNVGNLFTATAIGFCVVTLLGRPGELVRPYLIAVKERVTFSSQMAIWVLERIFDLLSSLLIFGFALSRLDPAMIELNAKFGWVLKTGGNVVAVVCAVCIGILLFFRHFSEVARERILEALAFLPAHQHRRADELVTAFSQGLEATRKGSVLSRILGYTVLEWALIVGCYFCLVWSFPGLSGLRPTDVLILLGFVAFGSLVQIPGVGGGVQLVTIVVLTELYGVGLEEATGVAVAVWILTFVVIVPVGLLLGLREGMNWKRIREIEEKAAI